MTPYYEQDGITIYHGDCLEVMESMWPKQDRVGCAPKFDLLLTDPPYGINRDGKPPSTSTHGGHKGYEFLGWDSEPPATDTLRLLLGICRDAVVFGANYYPQAFPKSSGWLLWDKGQRIDQADGELAFSTRQGPLRIFTLNRVALQSDGAVHPTQKPEALMQWCLGFFPSARTILDPFMGSGTTLVAAKRLGKSAVGIDIQEKYCEMAAKRLRQGALPMEFSA